MRTVTLGLLVVCMAALACGPRAPGSAATPALKDVQRETLVVLTEALPATLEPWRANMALLAPWMGNIYDTLTTRDREMEVRPSLASEWRQVDDLTWELMIRDGARSHGNQPITADLVVLALERSRSVTPSSTDVPYWPPLQGVSSIQAVGDRHVRLATRLPMPELPLRLSEVPITVPDGDAARDGTGRYRVASWTPEQRLDLESWPEHWAGPASVQKVSIRVRNGADERFAQLRQGEADIMTGLAPADFAAAKAGPEMDETAVAGPHLFYLALVPRSDASPLHQPEFRRALRMALDVESLGRDIYGGHLIRAQDLMPRTAAGGSPTPVDRDGARALLQRLRAAGTPVELMTTDGRFPWDSTLATAVLSALNELGLPSEHRVVDWSEIVAGIAPGAKDRVYLGAWENRLYDPTLGLADLLTRLQPSRPVGEILTAALEDAQRQVDPDVRSERLASALRLIHEEAPAVALFQPIELYAFRRHIRWQARNDLRVVLADVERIAR